MSAGPSRLTAAAQLGVPQVVSVGALDMVNLGPLADIPEAYKKRTLIQHNDFMTLMRTSVSESAEPGRRLAEKVSAATAPVAVFIPEHGVSSVAVEGAPFFDRAADQALFGAIRSHLSPHVRLVQRAVDINDEGFAIEAADLLAEFISQDRKQDRKNHV